MSEQTASTCAASCVDRLPSLAYENGNRMFEQSHVTVLLTSSTHMAITVALAVLAVGLGVLVALLRRDVRIQIGPFVIEPVARDTGDTTGPYRTIGSAGEETEPFDLEEISKAMTQSETLRAIEALRAVEAKLAQDNLAQAKARGTGVRTVRMSVCPLCILYEVTGNSPKCHVIPSDMRIVEVGRAPDGHIHSNQPNVSHRHFRLLIQPRGTHGRWAGYDVRLEDCGSRNGTWVNGVRVADNATIDLADGDIIEAASARYLFYFVLRVEN